MQNMKRCINLDWVELHALEPKPMDAEFFSSRGIKVVSREYGTPQYREMFTIYEQNEPTIEIRRSPYSVRSTGGIFSDRSVHIRLTNNVCYWHSPMIYLMRFLDKFGYDYCNLTRIDLALDFNQFDNGILFPNDFIDAFFTSVIAKIHQSKISAHGKALWDGVVFNSVKWGSPNSHITTKLYNKSMELREVHANGSKDYIKAAWAAADLNLDEDVWRIEFSLKGFSGFSNGEGAFIDNCPNAYDTREKLLYLFYSLYWHYFDFRYINTAKRKDRCIRVNLLNVEVKECYKPSAMILVTDPTRMERMVAKFLKERAAITTRTDDAYYLKSAADVVIRKKQHAISPQDASWFKPVITQSQEPDEEIYNIYDCDRSIYDEEFLK